MVVARLNHGMEAADQGTWGLGIQVWGGLGSQGT
jgi:hypothetical protein